MPKKFQLKKFKKYSSWWRFGGGIPITIMLLALFGTFLNIPKVNAASDCSDLKIIFARGSGGERWNDQNYLTFKKAMTDKLASTHIDYSFEDLDYPAVSVGNPLTLLTTFISAGEAYEFGASVKAGVSSLIDEVNGSSCSNTRYVLGGYSQGAMVVSKALPNLNPDKIIYAATFGDPKLYLPEGAGAVPAACSGKNLSNYRAYVPDCRAYLGMLGGYIPYQTSDFIDKLGTWCNKADFFCSSHLNIGDHLAYVKDEIYAEASKTIFDKVTKAFEIKNNYISMHDTAFLIDSTASMDKLIDKYKAEALSLARQTLENGGRVALYDYRDVGDRYQPREWCNFSTCDLYSFSAGLDAIETDGGGDTPESVLSSAFTMMQKLEWHYGATKSVVVLTDAGYHSPDGDGVTFDQVVALSKKIDPVNFYIITPGVWMPEYTSLALATDGAVVNSASDLSLLTEKIMKRWDSLPRVEENLVSGSEVAPVISGVSSGWISSDAAVVEWKTDGPRTLVFLNDYLLGATEEKFVVLEGLDPGVINTVRLVPVGEDVRGEGVEVEISGKWSGKVPGRPSENLDDDSDEVGLDFIEIDGKNILIPKVPNTGKAN